MTGSKELDTAIHDSELLYDQKLRADLELSHRDEFAALESVPGEYF